MKYQHCSGSHFLIHRLTRTLLIIFFTSACSAQGDHDVAKQLRDAEKIIPLEKILRRYAKQYSDHVLEVELETVHDHYVYEIELLDRKGNVRKLKIDAGTGALLRKR